MSTITETTATPAAWIGSLSAYNSGRLLGWWFDWDEIPESPREWVDAMIGHGQIPATDDEHRDMLAQVHEELWVFDHENFLGLIESECNPSTAAALGAILDGLEGHEREPFGAWIKDEGIDPTSAVDDFRDRYVGSFDTFREYADEQADEMMSLGEGPSRYDPASALYSIAETLQRYFDYDAWARDLEPSHTVVDLPSGGVAVFS